MIITRFAIRHFMAVLVMCVGIVIIGAYTYMDMPRENFPEIKFPFILVTTVLDGADPSDVETAVTIPLETELNGVSGIRKMNSTSSESTSVVMLEFEPEVETQTALQRVRDAVDAAKGDLPDDADEPIIKEFSLNEEHPILVYNLIGGADVALSELLDLAERIQDELETIPGVLDVNVSGGRDEEILIEVDPERLHHYKLTLGAVQGVLRGTNRNISAGAATLPSNRLIVRAPGEFTSPAEIFDLVIGAGDDGTPIHMRDVATVRYSFADEKSRARLYDFTDEDGVSPSDRYVEPKKAISIIVVKKTGSNELGVIEECVKKADTFYLPEGVHLVIVQDLSKDIRMVVSDLENGIGTSLILVLLVIFIGLGFRNAILVAWAIPFSMLMSIIVLTLLGFTLNSMVLYSLILALGMLVDNAIVIVENIYRHYSMGMGRAKAAYVGTSEVAWPVITSTVTTVGAFLPIAFWPGIMGEFMSYMPKTVIVVLASSLFVALVINPTLCALTMKRQKNVASTFDPETERPTNALAQLYGRFLEFVLDRPLWTLTTSLLILIATISIFGVFGRGIEFFPPLDPKRLIVSITPPDGTSLTTNDRFALEAEARLFGKPGSGFDKPVQNLKHVGVTIGLISGRIAGPGALRVEFVDRDYHSEDTSLTLEEVRNRVEGLDKAGNQVTYPLYGAEFDVVVPEEGPPTGKPVSIDIFGDDLGEMTRIIGDMKLLMSSVAGVVKPTDDAATAQPTLEWMVDRERAAMVGLDQSTVASALQMTIGGLKTGTFGHGDDERDILVRLPVEYRMDTRRIGSVYVPTMLGTSAPLITVANAELVSGPVQIKHLDRKRVLNAGAEVEPWVVADADIRAAFQKRVEEYSFPQGITYRFGGAAEEQEKSEKFLSKAFLIALFIISMVLVVQFNSVFVPAIVMFSVLLSFIGVFTGLMAFGKPFGIIMSGIGVISLAGIVVNNGIVLLDAIRRFEQRGLAVREAVVTASMIRLRPVLLTAITTILGLLPMAAKISVDFANMSYQYNTESSQWWQSMAVVVIFGLFVSTALTLGVVPASYVLYKNTKKTVAGVLGMDATSGMGEGR